MEQQRNNRKSQDHVVDLSKPRESRFLFVSLCTKKTSGQITIIPGSEILRGHFVWGLIPFTITILGLTKQPVLSLLPI